MGQSFLDSCLVSWLIQWQGALARALLTAEERVNTTIEFDTSALTRANLQVRTDSYSKAVGGPWLTADEARALENRPPIAGGDVLNEPAGAAPPQAKANPNHDNLGRFAVGAGAIIAEAAIGAAIAGPGGAAAGAAIGAFVESGAAEVVAKAAITIAGWSILPNWAASILTTVLFASKSLPPCTPTNIAKFLAAVPPEQLKRLSHDIVAAMNEGDQKTLLGQLAANDNNIPAKVQAA
jgi:hypothetical protein